MRKLPNPTHPLIAASMLAVLLLTGCVSVPKVEADQNAKARIKRVALLKIGEPQNVQVVNIGGAAGAFGIIGGLAQGVSNADHSKLFVEAVKNLKPALSDTLTAALTQALQDDGYAVTVLADQKVKPSADKKGLDFSEVKTDADAIAAITFGVVGYMSSPYSMHYEPWVVVRAQLVDAKTKTDLYLKLFCVGYKMKIENAVLLPADPKYSYKSFDDIMAKSAEAFSGLADSTKLAARQMGADLKP